MQNQRLYHSTKPGSALGPPPAKTRTVMRPLVLSGLTALAIFLSATASLRAGPITLGSQGFNANGEPITTNTGDVSSGTVFNFTNVGTTTNQTGVFVGLPNVLFGPVTLTTTSATGFDISNSVFGSFSSSSITTILRSATTSDFLIAGMWTPGTFGGFGGLTGGPFMADISLSFTQVGGTGSAISFSGTMAVTEASTVPEPSSLLLVGSGLLGLAGLLFRRARKPNLTLSY